ncbi:RNA polymerase sigma factor [Streptomyces sp. HNM0574]|nr:RNA polymerase sigma factor [Streptomyces sp. HNM0574]NLU68095.1 RNA polymerase sigma factor [Streptomyces sp. HNM0574]
MSEAFDAVFCELLQRLYKRAAMLVGSRLSAEDAVHEVYLKLAARPQNLLRHPEPYAYAFAALMSVVKDTWRRERRQVLMAEVEPSAGGGSFAWDGGVERRASELEVVRLLGQLSVKQAGAVVLVDLDGYTIDQAAEILKVHRGTVARSRSRALRKLRGSLGPPGSPAGTAAGATGTTVVRENHDA